jgi:hypothetical protein
MLTFLGIILRVLRLEVSIFIVDITDQFQTNFAQKRGVEENSIVEKSVNSKEEDS